MSCTSGEVTCFGCSKLGIVVWRPTLGPHREEVAYAGMFLYACAKTRGDLVQSISIMTPLVPF